MTAMADIPPDTPDDTAVEIDWDRDNTGAGQDPQEVTVVIGRWEWRSLTKRQEAQWTIDDYEVHVERGVTEPGLELEVEAGDTRVLRLKLTSEQYHSLKEHGMIQFQATPRTFPVGIRVVRRE